MGDKLTDRQKHIIARTGFSGELDYTYTPAEKAARDVVAEVIDYFEANPSGRDHDGFLPFPVATQTEQSFDVLAAIVDRLGASDLRIGHLESTTSARAALQAAVREVFARLGRAACAAIDHDMLVLLADDDPETGDGEDGTPPVP